jgi:uncharacterized protein YrrD
MRLQEGADVYTSDGDKAGDVSRVVIDPRNGEATHIVVEEGFLFTTKKVVPLNMIEEATEEEVKLWASEDELEGLPDFEERHYVSVYEAATEEAYEGYARPMYWYPPMGSSWWAAGGVGEDTRYFGYPIPPYVVASERHVPEGTVALEAGARVVTADGEYVGDVEEILTGPEANRVTHLRVSRGLLLEEEKLVPSTWIREVAEDEVRLAVEKRSLEELPDYED